MLNRNSRSFVRAVLQFVTAARGTALESHVNRISHHMDRIRDALPLNADTFATVILSFAYIARKGRVEADDLMRLDGHLPNALQSAANALLMAPSELLQQVESRGIPAEQFLPPFVCTYAATYAGSDDQEPDDPAGMTLEEFQAWSDQILRDYHNSEYGNLRVGSISPARAIVL